MNKRSAVLVASGLVLAMIAAAFGIMMGFTGPSSAGADAVRVQGQRKPVVKTVTDKRTIHRSAPGGSGSGTVVLTQTPAPKTNDASDEGDATTHGSGGGGSSDPTTEPSPDQSWTDGSETQAPEPSESHSESPSAPGSTDD